MEPMCHGDEVIERTDVNGNKWIKVYTGGGIHFENWLEQVIDIYGKVNVEVEEMNSTGLICFEKGGEKAFRIWVKDAVARDEIKATDL